MESSESWWMEIIHSKFEINDLISFTSNIVCNSIKESLMIFLLNVENIIFIFDGSNAFTHELVDDRCSQNWFQMSLFVWRECSSVSIKMNTKRWNIADCLLGVPENRTHFFGILVLDYDLSGKSKISIKPSSPKSTTIALDRHLLGTKFIVNFV